MRAFVAYGSRFEQGHVNSMLFHRGIDGLARHLRADAIVSAFAGAAECSGATAGSLLFVLVGWDRVDPVVRPGSFHSCLRAQIFEPDERQHRLWLEEDRNKFPQPMRERITYNSFGLGDGAMEGVNLTGVGKRFTGRVARGDAVLKSHVFMASIDVQGHEHSVLEGLSGLAAQGALDVMLVEAIGQNNASVRGTLDWLDAHDYIIFDFVPIRFCSAPWSATPTLSRNCSARSQGGSAWRVMDGEWYATQNRPKNATLASWMRSEPARSRSA